MHWIHWERVLASRDDEGLRVGSLFPYNRALFLRWRWRFFHYPDLLWFRVVKVLYGLKGHVTPLISRSACKGPWNGITRMLSNLHDHNFDFQSLCPIRIGDGAYTLFWHDVWLGDLPLATSFHGLFALDNHRTATVRDRINIGWDMCHFR